MTAEDELIQATPENRREAVRRFQEAVSRFSRLGLDNEIHPGWHGFYGSRTEQAPDSLSLTCPRGNLWIGEIYAVS
jgi:hypothetical protein